jgi:hypothetical protein
LQKCLTNTERTLAMNDFCALIELTASELDEVAGGSIFVSHSGNGNHSGNNSHNVSVSLHLNIENNAQTEINNDVDNSMNF